LAGKNLFIATPLSHTVMQVNTQAVKVDRSLSKPAAAQAAKPGPDSFSELLKGAQAAGAAQRDAGAVAAPSAATAAGAATANKA